MTYGYTDTEIDGGEFDGNQLPHIPENMYSVSLGWSTSTDVGDFDLRLLYDYMDENYGQIGFEDESTVDDRELVNFTATFTNGPWTLTGYVNNALDEEYNQSIVYSPPSPQAFGLFGLSFSAIGLPRMAGVKIRYEF